MISANERLCDGFLETGKGEAQRARPARWLMSAMIRVVLCACVLLTTLPTLSNAQAGAAAGVESGKRGEEAFKKAIDRLKSPDAAVRAQSADEMGRRGYRMRKEISDILRPIMLTDTESSVRAAAGRALGRLGVREAVPDLVRALRDRSADVRVVAAAALWRLPDAAAVSALLERCSDSEPAVREWSALALGVIGDRHAAPQLVTMLTDKERAVRLAAVRGLGRIGDPEATKPLLGYLSSSSRDNEEKEEVVNSLASIKGPDKVNALVQLLNAAENDTDQQVRVIGALGQVGDALVIPRLRRQTGEDVPAAVRTAATDAIKAVQDRIKAKAAAGKP